MGHEFNVNKKCGFEFSLWAKRGVSFGWDFGVPTMNKVGSYWFNQKASKEFNSVGDDHNSISNSIERGANWLINKLKGKLQKPQPDLLKEHGLPVEIFPRDATSYEFNEETGKLTVYIPSAYERWDEDESNDMGEVDRYFI